MPQKKLGVLPKDVATGPFVDEWKKVFGAISKDVEEVDSSLALSTTAFSIKDENELVRHGFIGADTGRPRMIMMTMMIT